MINMSPSVQVPKERKLFNLTFLVKTFESRPRARAPLMAAPTQRQRRTDVQKQKQRRTDVQKAISKETERERDRERRVKLK